MYDLKDRVAIVTGAGRKGGIGEAVARQLAKDGTHVVVGDICLDLNEPNCRVSLGGGGWVCSSALQDGFLPGHVSNGLDFFNSTHLRYPGWDTFL